MILVNVSALTRFVIAPTQHKSLMKKHVSVFAQKFCNVQGGRNSIHRLVSVNAQSLNHSAPHHNDSIQYHVNVSVVIDQTDAHILLKYLTKNSANVDAQRYLHALVDRDLTCKHVNVNAQNLDPHVLMIRNSMM